MGFGQKFKHVTSRVEGWRHSKIDWNKQHSDSTHHQDQDNRFLTTPSIYKSSPEMTTALVSATPRSPFIDSEISRTSPTSTSPEHLGQKRLLSHAPGNKYSMKDQNAFLSRSLSWCERSLLGRRSVLVDRTRVGQDSVSDNDDHVVERRSRAWPLQDHEACYQVSSARLAVPDYRDRHYANLDYFTSGKTTREKGVVEETEEDIARAGAPPPHQVCNKIVKSVVDLEESMDAASASGTPGELERTNAGLSPSPRPSLREQKKAHERAEALPRPTRACGKIVKSVALLEKNMDAASISSAGTAPERTDGGLSPPPNPFYKEKNKQDRFFGADISPISSLDNSIHGSRSSSRSNSIRRRTGIYTGNKAPAISSPAARLIYHESLLRTA